MEPEHEQEPEQTNQEGPKTQNSTVHISKGPSPQFVTPTPKQLAENIVRSNSSTETNKYKCTITSERLAQLKKTVEEALKEHQTFTIKGGWQTLRNALLKRNWVEKYEVVQKKTQSAHCQQNLDDLCSNLPCRQAWESSAAHLVKCEKTIMSRLLQIHDVDFYWNMRRDQSDWQHRVNPNKIMNRFSRSLYTSKEGLCLLLQQLYWHTEPGVAHVNFPRCYVLGFPDHFSNFVDDFRLTACMGLLKWFVQKLESHDEYAVRSPEGKVPFTALQFAVNRLNEHIACRKHLDIDKDFPQVWDHEWDQFLTHFHRIVHQNALFLDSKDWSISVLHAAAKLTLVEITKFWPQFELDGVKNIWILKPGNKCRGRGIQLVKNVEDVAKVMNMKLKYVVQKYIENPLLIYKTKFDIRQWFMITCVQPLTIWMYRECYFRFSSQIFNLENFHESLHLTNHAVQCKYTNVQQRDKALPEDNMWDSTTFKAYLKQIGYENKWDEVIYPGTISKGLVKIIRIIVLGMRQSIIGSMLACQETMDRRPNSFELYGADFILAEDFTPWLLEINSSPDLSNSTSVTSRLCPQVLEDVIKVVIDKRKDPKADTGMFDLIFKQNFPRPPAYLGMSLSVRGRRVFKNRAKRSKPSAKENNDNLKKESITLRAPLPILNQPNYMTKLISAETYEGPIIGDLMEEIQSSFHHKDKESGNDKSVEIVPAIQLPAKAKKKHAGNKQERVSKSEYGALKTKTHKKRFVNRKAKGNANAKVTSSSRHKNKCIIKNCFGLFIERSPDSEAQKDDVVWEKQTATILKGKNIQAKINTANKETCKSPYCLDSVSLNSILPQLNTSNADDSFLKKSLLTVGLKFRKSPSGISK